MPFRTPAALLVPFVGTTAGVLVLRALGAIGLESPGLIVPFITVASTAVGLKLLTPVLGRRYRAAVSVLYFLAMFGMQFSYALMLVGHLFGDWL